MQAAELVEAAAAVLAAATSCSAIGPFGALFFHYARCRTDGILDLCVAAAEWQADTAFPRSVASRLPSIHCRLAVALGASLLSALPAELDRNLDIPS